MKSKKGILGKSAPAGKGKTVYLTAIGLGQGYYAAGMVSGHIFVFQSNKLVLTVDAHKSSTSRTGCQSLHMKTEPFTSGGYQQGQTKEQVQFVSGGSDGQIILWDFKFPRDGSTASLTEVRERVGGRAGRVQEGAGGRG